MQKVEFVFEKEKKLNCKVIDKLKFYGVVIFFFLFCVGFIWFIFKLDVFEMVEGMVGINMMIFDVIVLEIMVDKQKVYELEEMKKCR